MMRKKNFVRAVSLAAALSLCTVLSAGCGTKTPQPDIPDDPTLSRGYLYEKQSESLMQFYSPDTGLDSFLNEYMERHLRYTDRAVNALPIGAGNTIWKEWESMSVMFMNTSALGYDPKASIRNWAQNVFQDEFGYVWMDNGTDSSSWGQNWEFPGVSHSHGNNRDFVFNSANGWTAVSDRGDAGVLSDGVLSVSGESIRSATFEIDDGTRLANTFHAPFVEVKLNLLDRDSLGGSEQVEDIFLSWKTEGDSEFDPSKRVSYSDFSTTLFGKFPSSAMVVFPMYANLGWGDDQKVTALRLEVRFKNGANADVALDRVRLAYDARQINNNGVFIAAVANYFEYTQDEAFLKEILPKLRRAMQFYLTYCGGGDGLVSTENFTGHDGSDNKDFMDTKGNSDVSKIRGIGSGIGDGYWDAISCPQVSSYCNNLYYLALNRMQYLERMASAAGIDAGPVKVRRADMSPGFENYRQDAESLDALVKTSRTAYNETFWDESAGRYILGYGPSGNKVDYGFTLFNQEAIEYGLADEAKAAKIMAWIDGERIVESDTSTGEDIYFYRFAPRWTTKKNDYQFWWQFAGTSSTYGWSHQVQNGGTAVHDAYYDLAATEKTGGPDASFAKLKQIQTWFEDVSGAGGVGTQFYRKYYSDLADDSATADRLVYKLQGGGAGAIGLDSEFLEAAILPASIPDLFFGLGSDSFRCLNVSPNLPAGLGWWKLENLSFGGVLYDLSAGKNFVQINSIRGDASDLTLCVTLPKPEGNFEVRQHNRVLAEGRDYTVSGNSVVVRVPFRNGRVQVIAN